MILKPDGSQRELGIPTVRDRLIQQALLQVLQPLPGWWQGVEQLNNRTASVYLRALLLTGARKEELAGLT